MNKTIKNCLYNFGIATGIAATVLFNAGSCVSDDKPESSKQATHDTLRLDVTNGAAVNGCNIIYRGMPSRDAFSISSGGYSDVNTYYSTSAKKIKYFSRELEVLKVTPDSLVLVYEK